MTSSDPVTTASHFASVVGDIDVLASRETDHRVANLLQIVVNGLERHASACAGTQACKAILEAAAQVQTIAYLQRLLAQENLPRRAIWSDRLEELCTLLHHLLFYTSGVKLQLSCQNFALPQNVWRDLALVITELMVNAAKHGFVGCDEGLLTISLFHQDGRAICSVRNERATGSCLLAPKVGYGTRLVNLLARRHGGEFTSHFVDAGAEATVTLPTPQPIL